MKRLIIGFAFLILMSLFLVIFLSVSECNLKMRYQALKTIKEIKICLYDLNYHVLSLRYENGVVSPHKLLSDLLAIRKEVADIESKINATNKTSSLELTNLKYLQNKVAKVERDYLYYSLYIKYMNKQKNSRGLFRWFAKRRAVGYLTKSNQAPRVYPEWSELVARQKLTLGKWQELK